MGIILPVAGWGWRIHLKPAEVGRKAGEVSNNRTVSGETSGRTWGGGGRGIDYHSREDSNLSENENKDIKRMERARSGHMPPASARASVQGSQQGVR